MCLTTTDSAMEDIVRTLLDPFGGSKWLKQAENKGKFNRTEYSLFIFSNMHYLYFDHLQKSRILFLFLFSLFNHIFITFFRIMIIISHFYSPCYFMQQMIFSRKISPVEEVQDPPHRHLK